MTHDNDLSRRSLIKAGFSVAGASFLPAGMLFADEQLSDKPRFFLQLFFEGGADSSYLFDARPRSMTAAGKIQNYLDKDPNPWIGSNGQSTLATTLVDPLKPFKDNFTVLNGVMMANGFDGHEQNKNHMLTGNPFGGDSVLPFLNQAKSGAPGPLDYLQIGNIQGIQIANASTSVSMTPNSARTFSKAASNETATSGSPALDFVDARLAALAGGQGLFSLGAKRMRSGLSSSSSLAKRLSQVKFPDDAQWTDTQKAVHLSMQYFRNGITRCGLISISNLALDAHDQGTAANQPKTLATVVDSIAAVFNALKNTMYDEEKKLSFLDVTTVMVLSEFTRTNYQSQKKMTETGTDHNPLGNQILLGGAGIKCGMVVGATDLDVLNDKGEFTGVTGAHKGLDGSLMKRMGKPFDFTTLAPMTGANPATFNVDQYLCYTNIANTLMSSFGVDSSHYWANARNGAAAKTLPGLLS